MSYSTARRAFFGTRSMPEPRLGSVLGDLTTSATKEEDGTYRVKGNKIECRGGGKGGSRLF
jgi:alkylation response protein AidB-like acyl-CoA dehydrogenase